MTDFLPEGYETPQTGGNYMKLQDGENKIRILSKPIIGWVDWKDKQAYRFPMKQKPDKPLDKNPIKHFWAFVVWNYNIQSIQILEITQQTIQTAIQSLSKDDDWGAPYAYDLKIIKKGRDLQTEYSVTPSPKKPVPDEVQKAALDKPVYLDALFHGADPWVVSDKQTELMIHDLPF